MASMLGAGGRGGSQMRRPLNLIFEEIVPSSGWTEDSHTYCIIINLPGNWLYIYVYVFFGLIIVLLSDFFQLLC